MKEFTTWLAATPLSELIQGKLWIIPLVQSVHFLALAVVLASVFMVYMRIMGLAGHGQTMEQMSDRFLPWLWTAFFVMALSGAVLVIGEPGRSLRNPAFWIKMALLACSLVLTVAFARSSRRTDLGWERSVSVRLLAVAGLLLWCATLIAGRWIAYVDINYE